MAGVLERVRCPLSLPGVPYFRKASAGGRRWCRAVSLGAVVIHHNLIHSGRHRHYRLQAAIIILAVHRNRNRKIRNIFIYYV